MKKRMILILIAVCCVLIMTACSTNCGFNFEQEEVGITHGGCNPRPIDGVNVRETEITIPASFLNSMCSTFMSRESITE